MADSETLVARCFVSLNKYTCICKSGCERDFWFRQRCGKRLVSLARLAPSAKVLLGAMSSRHDAMAMSLVARGVPRNWLRHVVDLAAGDAEALSELRQRKDLRRTVHRSLAQRSKHVTRCQELPTTTMPWKFVFLDPNMALYTLLSRDPAINAIFAECLETFPPPWRVVWGADECYSCNPMH